VGLVDRLAQVHRRIADETGAAVFEETSLAAPPFGTRRTGHQAQGAAQAGGPRAIVWLVDLWRGRFEEAQGGVGFGGMVVEADVEVVAFVEGLAEVGDLGLFGGSAQDEVVGNEGGFGHQSFHGEAETETAKTGGLCLAFFKINGEYQRLGISGLSPWCHRTLPTIFLLDLHVCFYSAAMDSAAECLIELATRPLDGNAELQLAAVVELHERIDAGEPLPPAAFAEAAEALARADARPRRCRWRVALWIVMAVVSLPLLGHTLVQYVVLGEYLKWIDMNSPPSRMPIFCQAFPDVGRLCGKPWLALAKGLPREQALLLVGDPDKFWEAEQFRPLWLVDSDNPAYFAEYAAACCQWHGSLPADFTATVARIDADNGWFCALAAAVAARDNPIRKELSPKERAVGKAPEWEIRDSKRLEEALALLHEAASKSRHTSYQGELLRQRAALLPPARDFVSQTALMTCDDLWPSKSGHLYFLASAIAAGAQEYSAKGDREGFLRLLGDWRSLAKASVADGATVLDLLHARRVMLDPLPNLRDAARTLGLYEDALRLAALEEQQRVQRNERRLRNRSSSGDITIRGSIYCRGFMPPCGELVEWSPTVVENDLRPGRHADHALLQRFLAVAGWGLIGLFAGLGALQRFRHGLLVRALSARLLDLLEGTDWAWILLGGTMLPLAWHACITYLTPLTAREWSLAGSGFFQAAGQTGATVCLLVILPFVIARWRLAKRGRVLGLDHGKLWIGREAAQFAALAVPAFGVPMWSELQSEWGTLFPTVLLGIPVLWWLLTLVAALFGRRTAALQRATLFRAALPAWALAMFLLAASLPLHYAEERRCVREEQLMKISTFVPSVSNYEYQVTRQLRRELLDLAKECQW